jgi:hypothetical protein
MASEPAEPTTRPQDDVIERARQLIDDEVMTRAGRSVGDLASGHVARALAEAGLLADPAQTTELEELRLLNRRMQRQVDRLPWRQRDYERARLELRKLNDAMIRKNRVIAKRRAERDALSLLLRGMARKLVATRGQARLQAALSLEINQGWVAYRERTKVRRRKFLDDIATLTGERDTLERILSKERRKVDGALALIAAGTSAGPHFLSPDATRAVRVGDQQPRPGLTHVLAWLNRKVEQIEAEGDIDHDPKTDGQHYAYVQAHAAVGLAITHPDRWMNEVWPPLSGVALRDVEEADDAAEPACECFVVPEEQWTRHYDATEPGSMFEQNPDCPVHPAKQADDAAGDGK